MIDNERRNTHRRSVKKCAGTFSTRGTIGRLLGLGTTFPFKALDCSMDGMRMVSLAPIQRDQHYTFTFKNPRQGQTFHVGGEVMWVEPVTDPADGSRGYWAGVRFDELGINQHGHLSDHLKAVGERDVEIRKTQVRRYYGRHSID